MPSDRQTRRASLIETATNITLGFGINFAMNLTVLPLFGLHPSPGTAFHMGLVFTVVAILRGYTLRRLFEALRVSGWLR